MCGIFGIYSLHTGGNINLVDVLKSLKKIQHRGMDSHGVAFIDNKSTKIDIYKKKGLVNEETININVKCAIAHVRYGTASTNQYSLKEAQPLVYESNYALAHNGNIPNLNIHDSHYLLKYIVESKDDLLTTLVSLLNDIPASYSMTILYENKIYIIRDRFGIRPLYYCINDSYAMVCSETIPFPENSCVYEVNPGEILELSETGISHLYQHPQIQNSLCAFELLYFMNPEHKYNNSNIWQLRYELGKKLAKGDKDIIQNDTIVVGIPTSGIAYGKGFAKETYLPYKQLISKNDTLHFGADRTFILKNNEERNKACREKFKYDEVDIRGKNIVVVDDTIVRGNVIKNIILRLKSCGAREIHIRIPSPPVIDTCQLGIDIKTREELLMYNFNIIDAAAYLGVDSLRFLEVKDLTEFPADCYAHCFGKPMPNEINNYINNKIDQHSNSTSNNN